jgi:metallo-beta-lactamase family protein
MLSGQRVEINASVQTISGYSAHADQDNLVRFVKGIYRKPREIRIVHGDDAAKEALAERLRQVVPEARVMIAE